MIKKDMSVMDKEAVNYLNAFEVQFEEEIKEVLASPDFANLKVSYALSVANNYGNDAVFKIEDNASLSLSNSYKFITAIKSRLKQQEEELQLFLGTKAQLRIKFILKDKSTDKSKEKQPSEDALMYMPIEPRYSFDQLILPDDVKTEIMEALNLLKYQKLIYKVWGFEKVDPIAKSVLNFYGPPGTGKTMCAHTVAKQLGKKLLALNYAEIESKYVGDAAKNLTNAFNTAKDHNCVLFFDEADSFLGKRIQNVTQGADQALNSLRSQMLILLEEFEGVVIFATNLVSNFDQAFESRILKHINFVLPNEEARSVIIKKMIPEHLPFTEPLTTENIAALSAIMDGLSGREIKGAILECLLAKVSKEGEQSVFCYDDFEKAFQHKQDSLKALQQEKNRAKSEKILQALKDKAEQEAIAAEEEKKAKQSRLIRLVAETGTYFGKCDGCYDDSEKAFTNNYIANIQKNHNLSEEEIQNIKSSVNEDVSLEEIIKKTNTFINDLEDDEKIPFKRTMSYFIFHLIRADGVLHPNEVDSYETWKKGVDIDDNIDLPQEQEDCSDTAEQR